MYQFTEKTKDAILKKTGLNLVEIKTLSDEEVEKRIESKIGKKLKLINPEDARLYGRGSVYIFLKRLMGISEIDTKLSKI